MNSVARAEETTVRVRLAWGSGAETTQRWSGHIAFEGAQLSDLQPLGIEADEAAALRLHENRLLVSPLEKRRFDGCDVTVRGDQQSKLHIELRSDQAPQPKVVETTLDEILRGQFRAPLDDFGSFLLAHRSPGDKLRVIPPGDSLVFSPGEQWLLKLQPDLADEVARGAVMLNLQLRAVGAETVLWESSQAINKDTPAELAFDIMCPTTESAYRVTIEARGQEGFANRIVPWNQAKVFASRDVEFVVIDPNAKLPPLADRWLPVLSVDPANPGWWQRLPNWAQMSRLRGRPPGAVGNVRPVVRPGTTGELVELPPAPAEGDPYWQAYTLPVKEPGVPHLIEVEYPAGLEQLLSISVIEPDAAGRVMAADVDAGMFTESNQGADGELGVYRLVFWPRTKSPQLLLVNRHASQPAQFGKLTLQRHDDEAAEQLASEEPAQDQRLVAGYIAMPNFAANFGAAEMLDEPSGLSVQGWSTFLDGATRMAQYLKLCGYNGALVTVAADGSSIYPSEVLNPSPRYDTGVMASLAQDPTRKDVLEMLLRVFDREGLRLVPTLQLATPLPRLEGLRVAGDATSMGIALVDHTGKTWLERNAPSAGLGAYYNPLHEEVQSEVARLVDELTGRYASHRSLAGVGIQLSGAGYCMLPGLAWGLDDHTMAQFTKETQVTLPTEGDDRFLRRAEILVGAEREKWRNWRSAELAEFYAQLSEKLTRDREDLQLLLTTEDVFAGVIQQRRLREAVSGSIELDQALVDHGLDLAKLDRDEHTTVLGAYRRDARNQLSLQALDLRLNTAAEQGEIVPLDKERGVLIYHLPSAQRLASFDRLSPYGADQTHLSLSSLSLPAGAAARKPLVAALARGDARVIVDGGLRQPLGQHAEVRSILETIRQLPDAASEVRAESKQPLVMRIYRSANSTTVLLLNESPWPLSVRLPLQSGGECVWRSLSDYPGNAPTEPSSKTGALTGGDQLWEVELAPYDLRAWTFASEELRVDEPQIVLNDLARTQLQERIDEIESRTGNLNIQRPYLQLQNPGFEMQDAGDRIFGWQTRGGLPGAVSVASDAAHAGNHSLRLKSEDANGVAVESHLFPMPQTGQIVVGVFVRGRDVGPDARMHIAIEDGENGRIYQQYATLSPEQLTTGDWTRYEFPVDDVPFDTDGQMRVRFQLFGRAEVLVDDVELYDLRFDSAQRGALVKRIYAAKTALKEGQLVDCQRLVDGYWSRYLVENVPPVATATPSVAAQPALPEPTPEPEKDNRETEESPGFGGRLRNWMPRILR